MFEQPKYVQSSFSVIFPRDSTIRKKAAGFEDVLTAKYSQPYMINVPDELEPEIPRMIFRSKYRQIVISQISIMITTTFSTDWQNDPVKGREYVLKHAPIVFKLLPVIGDVKPCFCGLTTEVHLSGQISNQEILAHLSRVFLKENSTSNLHDIEIKTTEAISGHFFNNISVANYRIWQDEPQRVMPSPDIDALDRGIKVISDFNDRYAFNEIENYHSSKEIASKVIEGGFEAIRGVITRITEATI